MARLSIRACLSFAFLTSVRGSFPKHNGQDGSVHDDNQVESGQASAQGLPSAVATGQNDDFQSDTNRYAKQAVEHHPEELVDNGHPLVEERWTISEKYPDTKKASNLPETTHVGQNNTASLQHGLRTIIAGPLITGLSPQFPFYSTPWIQGAPTQEVELHCNLHGQEGPCFSTPAPQQGMATTAPVQNIPMQFYQIPGQHELIRHLLPVGYPLPPLVSSRGLNPSMPTTLLPFNARDWFGKDGFEDSPASYALYGSRRNVPSDVGSNAMDIEDIGSMVVGQESADDLAQDQSTEITRQKSTDEFGESATSSPDNHHRSPGEGSDRSSPDDFDTFRSTTVRPNKFESEEVKPLFTDRNDDMDIDSPPFAQEELLEGGVTTSPSETPRRQVMKIEFEGFDEPSSTRQSVKEFLESNRLVHDAMLDQGSALMQQLKAHTRGAEAGVQSAPRALRSDEKKLTRAVVGGFGAKNNYSGVLDSTRSGASQGSGISQASGVNGSSLFNRETRMGRAQHRRAESDTRLKGGNSQTNGLMRPFHAGPPIPVTNQISAWDEYVKTTEARRKPLKRTGSPAGITSATLGVSPLEGLSAIGAAGNTGLGGGSSGIKGMPSSPARIVRRVSDPPGIINSLPVVSAFNPALTSPAFTSPSYRDVVAEFALPATSGQTGQNLGGSQPGEQTFLMGTQQPMRLHEELIDRIKLANDAWKTAAATTGGDAWRTGGPVVIKRDGFAEFSMATPPQSDHEGSNHENQEEEEDFGEEEAARKVNDMDASGIVMESQNDDRAPSSMVSKNDGTPNGAVQTGMPAAGIRNVQSNDTFKPNLTDYEEAEREEKQSPAMSDELTESPKITEPTKRYINLGHGISQRDTKAIAAAKAANAISRGDAAKSRARRRVIHPAALHQRNMMTIRYPRFEVSDDSDTAEDEDDDRSPTWSEDRENALNGLRTFDKIGMDNMASEAADDRLRRIVFDAIEDDASQAQMTDDMKKEAQMTDKQMLQDGMKNQVFESSMKMDPGRVGEWVDYRSKEHAFDAIKNEVANRKLQRKSFFGLKDYTRVYSGRNAPNAGSSGNDADTPYAGSSGKNVVGIPYAASTYSKGVGFDAFTNNADGDIAADFTLKHNLKRKAFRTLSEGIRNRSSKEILGKRSASSDSSEERFSGDMEALQKTLAKIAIDSKSSNLADHQSTATPTPGNDSHKSSAQQSQAGFTPQQSQAMQLAMQLVKVDVSQRRQARPRRAVGSSSQSSQSTPTVSPQSSRRFGAKKRTVSLGKQLTEVSPKDKPSYPEEPRQTRNSRLAGAGIPKVGSHFCKEGTCSVM